MQFVGGYNSNCDMQFPLKKKKKKLLEGLNNSNWKNWNCKRKKNELTH